MMRTWRVRGGGALWTVLGLLLLTTYMLFRDAGLDTKRSADHNVEQFQMSDGMQISKHFLKSKGPKVYIYPLPEKFNVDIQTCASSSCMHFENKGFGPYLHDDGDMKVFGTNHFSLEVNLHNQLHNSRYRTDEPSEADVFYIPAYMGTKFFCNQTLTENMVIELFNEINRLPFFKEGRPHISALAKIEREEIHITSPVLLNPLTRHVTFFVIEKEAKESSRNILGLNDQPVIVVPYPSYGHLDSSLSTEQTISSPSLQSRSVFMLLAASIRKNVFRSRVLDQMSVKIKGISYDDIWRANGNMFEVVWIETPECDKISVNITLDWMKHSVFCLQPHGDSPTRKSFYDSIVSGCIPVIFKFPNENVEYPFQRVLNYSDFVVSIDGARVENGERILTMLKEISNEEIQRLHNNVLKVARQLQYSYIDDTKDNTDSPYVDALDMLMDEVAHTFNL